jgi:glycosyltransferase involved in cell wall biosynthesis
MEDNIVISILIPTIPERKDIFTKLYKNVFDQIELCNVTHPVLGFCEILFDDDKKVIYGGKTVGKKRNDLVQRAEGKYLCFLDDDDEIPSNYIETLLRMAMSDSDILTFRSLFKCDLYWSVCDMGLNYPIEEATPEGIFKRPPFHICPVKSEFAQQFNFPDKNNAEDWEWMSQVLTLVTTEEKTNVILHQYNHSQKTSAVDEIEHFNSESL